MSKENLSIVDGIRKIPWYEKPDRWYLFNRLQNMRFWKDMWTLEEMEYCYDYIELSRFWFKARSPSREYSRQDFVTELVENNVIQLYLGIIGLDNIHWTDLFGIELYDFGELI